jgi:hypothetical protein
MLKLAPWLIACALCVGNFSAYGARANSGVVAQGNAQGVLSEMNRATAWILDVAPAPSEMDHAYQLLAKSWKSASPQRKESLVNSRNALVGFIKDLDSRTDAERRAMRLSARQQMLSEFRKSARHSEYARWWLGQYESKMLVASAPPLTQGVADYWTQLRLWALDIPATVEQYLEYQEVLIEAWKTAASRDREGVVNAAQYARTIAGLSVDKQHLVRIGNSKHFLRCHDGC